MDHHEKLAWARKHLDALNSAMQTFANSKPYTAVAKFDEKDACYVAWIKRADTVPFDLALIVGDVVHSLRSALDTLTYALAVANLGRVPTYDEVRQIQFVIVDNIAAWPNECHRRLRHLSIAAQADIETLQPYHRPDSAATHGLSVLRDLSNVDKHRHLVMTLAAASSSSFSIEGPNVTPNTVLSGYSGPIEQGTVIKRWRFSDVPAGVMPEMSVHGNLGLYVAFGDAGPANGVSVKTFLWAVHDHIRDEILPILERHLL